MAIVTATQVTLYTDISASAGTIVDSGLIPIVQERINLITNNYFLSDIDMQGEFVFSPTANTIYTDADWADEGFAANDEIYIYHSYRNDGYKVIASILDGTITLSSANTVIAEKTGRDIMINLVQWPLAIAYIAAQMVKFDYDDRPVREPGVKSKSLGPYSVSYGAGMGGENKTPFGYPQELIDGLSSYTIVRLN